MMRFVTEIESALNLPSGRPCTLNAFLADYVKEVIIFLTYLTSNKLSSHEIFTFLKCYLKM